MTAELRAHVPHVAPGDPVTVAVWFAADAGRVGRDESLEVAIARPDGTTARARAPARGLGAAGFVVDIAPGELFDLAGRYRVSVAGVAHGDPPRRFTSREIEIEVMGDGRLPLAEIERRARVELARRQRVTAGPEAVVTEGPGGDREVRFAAGDAVYVVRLSPAGTVLAVETGPPP